MSKSIKVSERNYNRIVGLLRPREAMDDVITRAFDTQEKARELLDTIEGSIKFREGQRARIESTPALD